MRHLIPLLIAACETRALPLPDGALPPPLGLQVGAIVPGEAVSFDVDGATPGAQVAIVVSMNGAGAGPCVRALRGSCLDVQDPVSLVAMGTADGLGALHVDLTVPASLPVGRAPAFQAAEVPPAGASAVLSNVVEAVVEGAVIPFVAPDVVSTVTLPWDVSTLTTSATVTGQSASLAGVSPVDIVALTGAVTFRGGSFPVAGATVTDTGLGRYTLSLPLSSVNFRSTNPQTFDVALDLELVDGTHHVTDFYWTVGAMPDRVGLMWNGTTGYLVTSPLLVPRSGVSVSFGSATYGPQFASTTGVYRLLGGSAPVPTALDGVWCSAGVRTASPFDEATYDTFTLINPGPFVYVYQATGPGTWSGVVMVADPLDWDGDGVINGDDVVYLMTDWI